jgi:hypothetical protein
MMIAQEKTEKKSRTSRTSWTTMLASAINLIIFILDRVDSKVA